jgi:hypothetical protein
LRYLAAAKRAIAAARESAFWLASGLAPGLKVMPPVQPSAAAIVGQLSLAAFLHPLLPLAFLCPQ